MTSTDFLDAETFTDLYRKHKKSVEKIVRGFRFLDATADDLVQEIFVRAWSKRENLRDVTAFGGWLQSIARNACLSEWKKRKDSYSISTSEDESEEGNCRSAILLAVNPEESLILEFSLEILRQAIRYHKHPVRAKIAHAFYIEEAGIDQIAKDLGMNPNTILSHLHRFRLVVSRAMTGLVNNHDLEFESTRRKLLRA